MNKDNSKILLLLMSQLTYFFLIRVCHWRILLDFSFLLYGQPKVSFTIYPWSRGSDPFFQMWTLPRIVIVSVYSLAQEKSPKKNFVPSAVKILGPPMDFSYKSLSFYLDFNFYSISLTLGYYILYSCTAYGIFTWKYVVEVKNLN